MQTGNENAPSTMLEDDARSGVTGHNVRYVLLYGLVGVITAFIAIAVYSNFDGITEFVMAALSRDPAEVAREIAPFAVVFLSGALATLVLFTIWNLILGTSQSASQRIMRLRVILQFVIICAMGGMLYLVAP